MSSVARPFFLRLFRMRRFDAVRDGGGAEVSAGEDESITAYRGMAQPGVLKGLGLALLLSAAIVGLSAWVGGLLPPTEGTAVTILLITTLAIALSFVKPVREIKKTFQAGMYVIYVFCFVVASMTRFDCLVHIDWHILVFVTVSILGSLALHGLLSKLFDIDVDTFIITSVSAICSPPFVPVVANGLKNKAVLVSGITTGIVGYAIGNYLGISVAYLLNRLPL